MTSSYIDRGRVEARRIGEPLPPPRRRCSRRSPWDFNTHGPIDPAQVDLEALGPPDDRVRESFVSLRDAGFVFYFYGPLIDEV
jgi:hypothetical protein